MRLAQETRRATARLDAHGRVSDQKPFTGGVAPLGKVRVYALAPLRRFLSASTPKASARARTLEAQAICR
jgi:hypothetical protein